MTATKWVAYRTVLLPLNYIIVSYAGKDISNYYNANADDWNRLAQS